MGTIRVISFIVQLLLRHSYFWSSLSEPSIQIPSSKRQQKPSKICVCVVIFLFFFIQLVVHIHIFHSVKSVYPETVAEKDRDKVCSMLHRFLYNFLSMDVKTHRHVNSLLRPYTFSVTPVESKITIVWFFLFYSIL